MVAELKTANVITISITMPMYTMIANARSDGRAARSIS